MTPGEADARFEPFDPNLLPQLMRWFPDADACGAWGGPHFRFPFTPATFRADALVDSLPGWMLVDDATRLLAFGQYYRRLHRCHLGRLAVQPSARGQGLGTRLIRELCQAGAAALATEEFSLFVLRRNVAATRLYLRLGFVDAEYPERLPASEPMSYMVAAGEAARHLLAKAL